VGQTVIDLVRTHRRNLGLTCDPVGAPVQVQCIERNAMAAVKAINAAGLALRGDGRHIVSLGKVIKTMPETCVMKIKYNETARGGLAFNVSTRRTTLVGACTAS
jgi:L-serine dehydratase